ncbi:hypothetical protein ES703_89552 [subsurface metagenome]
MNDTLLALTVLIGNEDEDFWLTETDPLWWEIYLWIKRN